MIRGKGERGCPVVEISALKGGVLFLLFRKGRQPEGKRLVGLYAEL